ncbi:MAG TPA: chemotaxis protein CheW [Bacteroidales bacterium]
MLSYSKQQLPPLINYRLVTADNMTLAFEASKVSKFAGEQELIKTALMPSFMLGIEKKHNMPVVDIFSLYNLKWGVNANPKVLVRVELFSHLGEQQKMAIGFIVNEYLGTLDIPTDKIKPFYPKNPADSSGIFKIDNKTICVLDVDNILSRNHFKELNAYLLVYKTLIIYIGNKLPLKR